MSDTLAPDSHILPAIKERWSPRSFDATPMPQEDLETILQAAGLAPSAFNAQPWRFLYAHRDGSHWDSFLSVLWPLNSAWAQNASVLLFIVSATRMEIGGEERPSWSHSFDAGAAWAQLALQATHLGYHCHAMVGVDFERARELLRVPADFRIEAGVAIGRKASADRLPEALREREKPNTRRPLAETAWSGPFLT